MIRRRNSRWLHSNVRPFLLLVCVALMALLLGYGCRKNAHTSDSRLQQIDELLNKQLPPGTPLARVDHFLKSRGYIVQDSPDKNSLVALVRHIDTETLQPATARVTFHFDSNQNLISYEMQLVPDAPLRP
jgi:ATP-dependent 26S proteasome regulatory subunit